jgi:DNA repair photolyase
MHQLPIYVKGRGAQINPSDPFSKTISDSSHKYYVDPGDPAIRSKYLVTHAKTLINKVDAPDIGMDYSMNPYQGCEHGCVYCYARNTHPYWGYSAGLDFESIIMVKKNAPALLSQKLRSKNWKGEPIMMSGNTDCYQPIEKKLKITRRMLEVIEQFHHPVGLVTKSQLILRDIDIIKRLADKRLIKVAISLNTLDDGLRQKLEPRAASVQSRLKTIQKLIEENIPVSVLMAPIIPGLNDHEVFDMVKKFSEMGVRDTYYIVIRLNGDVEEIFKDWLKKNYPDRVDKVMNKIADFHGGKVSDSRYTIRMKGEGTLAENLNAQFHLAKRKYMPPSEELKFDTSLYEQYKNPQLKMF